MNGGRSCRGAGDVGGVGFRWCRCARSPATCVHPSGMPAVWQNLRTSAVEDRVEDASTKTINIWSADIMTSAVEDRVEDASAGF